ncbi:MAG: M23 family metallopeptidase [Spirochaetota bacterium]
MSEPLLVRLKRKYQQYKELWQEKSKKNLTIMLVPHNHKKSVNIYISYKSIVIFLFITAMIMFLSTINVLNHNFKEYEVSELQLSNKDFAIQSERAVAEIKELHKRIAYYDEKIKSLYANIGGDKKELLKSLPANTRKLLQENYRDSKIPQEMQTFSSDSYKMQRSSELVEEIIKLINQKDNLVRNTPSIWPVSGYIMFPFGEYISPVTGKLVKNNGIDIGSFPGAEVKVTAPGFIYETGFTEYTGYYIKVAHKFGWKTIYSNMDRIQIKKGENVEKGELIGFVGKTSSSKYYSLHYEIHVGTSPLNPASFLNQIQE